MIKLSVHIMTYNCAKYIEQSLTSVLQQKTTFPFDIIVSDDVSSDSTYEIISSFAKNYDVIKPYRNRQNLGVLKNFKKTLDYCQGEYVFDLAGDDWLSDPYALQTLVDELDQNPSYSFVDSGFDVFHCRTGKITSFFNKKIVTGTKDNYKEFQKIYGNYLMGCCFRKKMLISLVDFDRYIEYGIDYEDYPILTDLVLNSDFGFIPKVLSVYRKHRLSHSNNTESFLKTKLFFADKYGFSKQEIQKIYNAHYNHQLHNAGLIGDKKLGRKHYKPFSQPILRNLVYFLSSQSYLARKFFNLFRKI